MSTTERMAGAVRTGRGRLHTRGLRGRVRSGLERLARNRATQRGRFLGLALQHGRTDLLVEHAPVASRRPAERLAERTGSARLARAGQRVDIVGAVLSLIIVAVIAYVGLDVIGEVEDTTGFDTSKNAENRTVFENGSVSLEEGVESAFGLMGVVLLVILLAVIIDLFLGLRR